MEDVKHKIIVLSGKGGVGKSTVAVNLAVWLSMQGRNVGLLDVDIHGPSVPKLLNLQSTPAQAYGDRIRPVTYSSTLRVMSIGFLLRKDSDALIWRGPMKHNLIRQFIADVSWGSLDYLVVDCPPGTGDEPLSVAQLLGEIVGAVIVTTPQQLAVIDVRKCITFCRQLNLAVLGVIENMSGFVCPHCSQRTDIFKGNGGRQMAEDFDVPFLGSIPIDPQIVRGCDAGEPYVRHYGRSATASAFEQAVRGILKLEKNGQITETYPTKKGEQKMRIAIPLVQDKLSAHFGHCERFAIVEADDTSKQITSRKDLTPPAHEPGALPRWLHGMGVNVIIAGGMGQRAQQLFAQNQIEVVVGAPTQSPEDLVSAHLNGKLECGENVCDH